MTASGIPDYMAQIRKIVETRMTEIGMTTERLAAEMQVVPREIVAFLDGVVEDLDLRTFSSLLYVLDLRPEIVTDKEEMKMTVVVHRGRG